MISREICRCGIQDLHGFPICSGLAEKLLQPHRIAVLRLVARRQKPLASPRIKRSKLAEQIALRRHPAEIPKLSGDYHRSPEMNHTVGKCGTVQQKQLVHLRQPVKYVRRPGNGVVAARSSLLAPADLLGIKQLEHGHRRLHHRGRRHGKRRQKGVRKQDFSLPDVADDQTDDAERKHAQHGDHADAGTAFFHFPEVLRGPFPAVLLYSAGHGAKIGIGSHLGNDRTGTAALDHRTGVKHIHHFPGVVFLGADDPVRRFFKRDILLTVDPHTDRKPV